MILSSSSVSLSVQAERTTLAPISIPSPSQSIVQTTEAQTASSTRGLSPLYIPKIPAEQINDLTTLVLEVHINKSKADDFGNFQQNQQGELLAYGKDLRQLRIKTDANVADNQLVKLSDIPNLVYQYHVESQSVDIQLPASQLNPYQIDMGRSRFDTQKNLDVGGITAGILNYRFYNVTSSYGDAFSANLEGIFSSDYGNFVSSGLYNNGDYAVNDNEFIRLDSYWQYVDPKTVRSWILGDFASNTVEWGSSVRLAGFQVASAYQQRSDIITTALPSWSGQAALPTSLDLYVNQQRIYSGDVPSGPFDINMLPSVSGNDVTLITRDATGRQIITTESFYYTPKVLRRGLAEYSVDIGVPRFGYATKSNDYDDHLFGMASLRYGWLPTTTLTGHTETTSNGLVNIGAGVAKTLGGMAAVNLDAAHSEYKGESGNLMLAGIEGRLTKQVTFNASTQRAYDNYFDAARVANMLYQQKYANRQRNTFYPDDAYLYDLISYSSIADRIDRYGLAWSPSSRLSLSAYYNEIGWANDTYRTVSLNASSNITNNVTLYSNFYKDLTHDKSYSLWLGVRVNLFDNKVFSTTSIMKDKERTGYSQDFSSSSSQQVNSFGWGVNATHYDKGSDFASVRGDYRTRAAWLNAQYAQSGSEHQTTLSATGSLVAAGGNVFAANEIGDAFAIVKNAGPGSSVLNGGVQLGKSDSEGNFLISHTQPWVENQIFIEAADTEEGWEPASTEQIAISGWRRGAVVDFRSAKINSATAKLYLTPAHEVIPPGYEVTLNNEYGAVVGYDGLVYLRGLKNGENHLSVNMLNKGTCRAQFNWQGSSSARTNIGDLLCQ